MKRVMFSFLMIILMSTIILAVNDSSGISIEERQVLTSRILENFQTRQELINQVQENIQERRHLQTEIMQNIREGMESGEELIVGGGGVVLRKVNAEIMELKEGNGSLVKTKLQLNNEDNASMLKVRLSNGRNAEIKIMPETASEKALQRLRLRNCNETNNCTIELKEVGEGNKTRVVYESRAHKTFKIFGLFKSQREIITQIDAETGEEVLTKRPWWSWMSSEEE